MTRFLAIADIANFGGPKVSERRRNMVDAIAGADVDLTQIRWYLFNRDELQLPDPVTERWRGLIYCFAFKNEDDFLKLKLMGIFDQLFHIECAEDQIIFKIDWDRNIELWVGFDSIL